MVFSSPVFLIVFLPVVLLLTYLIPGRGKNIVLLIASIFFYAWGEPVYVILMIFACIFNYVCGLEISTYKKSAKFTLVFAIAVNLLILGFFKYWGFILGTINSIPGVNIPYHDLPLPIGISFYTFQAISYIVDVYRKETEPQLNIIDFSLYISMFPQLVAGPIVKYHDIAEQLKTRQLSFENIKAGVPKFVRGLSKKILFADTLGLAYTQIYALGVDNLASVTAWIGIIAYTMQIYFDFSGYSDMAIGLGRMLGFEFQPNFNHPYIAKSITDFWRRWHMSLSTWFRDYVYIPLGGNRVKPARHIFNMLVVWSLTGLWHGAAWTFVAWGLYYGIILVIEKYITGRFIEKLPSILRILITLFFVVIGWVLFSSDTIGDAFNYLIAMFGGAAGSNGVAPGFFDDYSMYYLRTYIIPLLIGGFFCVPFAGNLIAKIQRRSKVIWTIIYIVAMILCIAFMVSSSYSPFLYFRF
ncbi:MAG: MBOAT family protein [Coriobacteriales bacterium]|nr:MBOAT family protein [Coriobacteriales bacterium]